jgi:TP901 family phage tail tape measure protein/lambda family phage tail tape measure protein
VTVAFGLPLVAAVKIAGDFEASLNRVQNVSRATAEQMVTVKDAAEQLGIQTAFSASQAADGFELLSKAGLSIETQLGAITPALNLAAAGSLELGVSAKIVTTIIAGFGLSVDKIGEAADILTRTAQSTQAGIQGLGDAFSFVAPKARQLGIDFLEVNVALGALANAGFPATRTGRGLQRMLSNLTEQTPKAKAALEKLGVEVFDGAGKFRGLLTVVADLREATKGLSDVTRATRIGDIFTEQGSRAIGALISQGDKIDVLVKKIGDFEGAAQDAADTVLKGFNGALRELSSAVQGAGISIGDTLLGPLEFLVRRARDAFRILAALPKPIQQLIGAILGAGTAFGVLALGIAGVSFAMANFARLAAVEGVAVLIGLSKSAVVATGALLRLGIVQQLAIGMAGMRTAAFALAAGLRAVAVSAGKAVIALGFVGVAAIAIVAMGAALISARDDVISFGQSQTTLRDITATVWGDIKGFFESGTEAAEEAGDAGFEALRKLEEAEANLSLGVKILKAYDDMVVGANIMARVISLIFNRLVDVIQSPFVTLVDLIRELPRLIADPGNAGVRLGEIIRSNIVRPLDGLGAEITRITREEMSGIKASELLGTSDIIQRAAERTTGRADAAPGGAPAAGGVDPAATTAGAAAVAELTREQERLKNIVDGLRQSVNGLTPSQQALADAQRDLNLAVNEGVISQQQSDVILRQLGEKTFTELKNKVDPVSAAYAQQEQQLQSLATAAEVGAISLDQLAAAQGLVRDKTMEALLNMREFNNTLTGTEALTTGVREGFAGFGESLGNEFTLVRDATKNILDQGLSAIDKFVQTGKFSFKDFASGAIKEIQKVITRILIMKALSALGGAGGGIGSFFGGGKASGGAVNPNQAFLVGERGPEMFVPPSSGQIVPNETLGAMAAPPPVNVQVVNVDDPASIPEALNSRDSEAAIMNVMQRNSAKLKAIIS